MRNYLLILGVIVIAVACIAGCATTPPYTTPTPTPTITTITAPQVSITSPANGATLPAGNVTVTVSVKNLNIVDKQGQANVAGQGHVHFYLDVSPIPSTPGQPAIPANANAVWAHVSGTTYTFTNVSPGMHTIVVQLVNNDHSPITPLVTATITITVTGTPTTVQTTTAPPTTTVPPTTTLPPTTTVPSGGGGGYGY